MSSKKRKSNRSSGSPNVSLLGLIVVLVIILVGGYLFYQNTQQKAATPVPEPVAANAEQPEQQVGDLARKPGPTLAPGITVGQIGSGGSLKNDWYELYFTNPIYPDKPANHKGGPDEPLVKMMDKATKTLDVADYDFDLANVVDAMVRAKQRGVQVRMVTDSDTINNVKNKPVQDAFARLKQANIPFYGDERSPIMHNKFTVVDNKLISTGSMNYTDGDAYRLNNNLIIINNAQLAQNYTAEFEKMFVQKTFGPNKAKGVPNPVLDINGVKVENYFAAEDGVAAKIIETLKSAKQSIYFMAFSFTHNGITQTLVERQTAGVKIGGVFETTGSSTPFSAFGKLKKAGVQEVYTDGNPWVMHHKVFIVDEQIVVFGSFNFSDNADKANDENLLIIHDPNMAKAFKAEYDRVLALAKNPPVKK